MKKFTYEQVKSIVSEISDCELLSTKYEDANSKLTFKCPCGNVFEKTLHHFRNDTVKGCPVCAHKKVNSNNRLDLNDVAERFKRVGCELVSTDYKNRRTPVAVKCKCGHTKMMRLNSAIESFSGYCDECSRKMFSGSNRLSLDDLRERCKSLGVELVSEEYKNARAPIVVRCKCGSAYTTTWFSLSYQGKTRCDKCSGIQSRGSSLVQSWLDTNGFQYEKEKVFPGCGGLVRPYRFDFFLPEENTCIEYDGQQHFKVVNFTGKMSEDECLENLVDTISRDFDKERFCEENEIKLIRIPYTDIDNIDSILSGKLIPR